MVETMVKQFRLDEEVLTSVRLIKKGLCELSRISYANNFYHVPILLLSTGFERLIKILIIIARSDDNLDFLDENEKENLIQKYFKRRNGHNIKRLLNKLLSILEDREYRNKFPAAETDIEYLTTDRFFLEVIQLLSDFGLSGRYYNLNIVLNLTVVDESPEDVWNKLENAIVSQNARLKSQWAEKEYDEFYKGINNELNVVLERFARALARLFTRGDLGELGKRVSGHVHEFLFLNDNDLGKTDWCQKLP